MNNQFDLEQALRVHFEARSDRTASDGQLTAIFDRTARHGQRPAWLAALRSPTMSATTLAARPAIPRAAWLLVALGLLAAVVAGAIIVGSPDAEPDAPVNGLIVFGRMNEALGDTVVYTIHPDGSNEQEVRPETHEGPFWSPDGKRLGLGHSVSNPDGSNYLIWDQSGNAFHVECWDWSPDGERMLCEGFSEDVEADAEIHGVYTVRASDGGDLVRLSPPGEGGVACSYSPDGRTVAYLGAFEGAESALILRNVDGTNPRRLGLVPYQCGHWAPDGRSLLATNQARLYSIDVVTGVATPIRIASAPGADIFEGLWSPDGTRILIRRHMSGDNVDLFTMLPDGTDLIQVTDTPEEERFVDWGVHPLE